jgi:hypothetical protein
MVTFPSQNKKNYAVYLFMDSFATAQRILLAERKPVSRQKTVQNVAMRLKEQIITNFSLITTRRHVRILFFNSRPAP